MTIPHEHKNPIPVYTWILLSVLVILLGVIGYGTYRYRTVTASLYATETELASTTEALRVQTEVVLNAEHTNSDLTLKLNSEVEKNNAIDAQIQTITSTVNTLDKLSKTDRELLQKYSNVYFLSENYIPSALNDIDSTYLYRKEKPEKIHTNVKPFLENMLRAAQADTVTIDILSAYRSFGTQANLKASYKVTYGAGTANKFSADQGYSEHQLGSTVDFTATSTGENLNGFEKTPAYTWLLANAHRFGFIISYPKSNKFFQYEPWHWRFVGVELATKLHTEGKYFYDLDQRDMNTYLAKIFD